MNDRKKTKPEEPLDLNMDRADRFTWAPGDLTVDNSEAVGERLQLSPKKGSAKSTD